MEKHQIYFGENLHTDELGQCFWDESNWLLDSEEEAKKEIRQNVYQINIGTLFCLKDILKITIEKGETEDDRVHGYSIDNLNKRIPQLINNLKTVFGLTEKEVLDAVNCEENRRNACKTRFEKTKDIKGENRIELVKQIEEEMKKELAYPTLSEKNHVFCDEYLNNHSK